MGARQLATTPAPCAGVAGQLSGRRLLTAHAGVATVALLALVCFSWSLPAHFATLKLYWFSTSPPPDIVREGLEHLGLTPGLYAGYGLAVYVGRAAVFWALGGLLVWRKPADRLALLVASFLIALPIGDTDPAVLHTLATHAPVQAALNESVELVGFVLLLWLCLLFPDVRFRPSWTRALAVCWLLVGAGSLFFPDSPLDMLAWSGLLFAAFIPASAAIAVGAQVWRYRHTSSPTERQQTKWFALGFTIVLLEFTVGNMLTNYRPLAWPAASPARVVLTDVVLNTIHTVAFLAIPATLAVAILRHRLWDIDALINRALVYGSLSATLLAVYLASVVLLEAVLRAATSQSSNVVIAAATLATAALVQPLRRGLQAGIDRRFYRRKYDAARAVDAFGAALRDETDLGRIKAGLLAIVDETLQPAHTSLWILTPAR